MLDVMVCGSKAVKAVQCNFHIYSLCKKFAFIFRSTVFCMVTSVNAKVSSAQWKEVWRGEA